MPRRHLSITGRVQGVGFRWSTQSKAASLGLQGWVRNRSDGSVETEFEGGEESVARMREWCARGPSGAEVRDVDELEPTDAPAYSTFEIRY